MSVEIGKNVFFYGEVDIKGKGIIQDNVTIGSSEEGKVEIGEDSLIRSGTVIYSGAKIGERFRTGHNVVVRENTRIGDNVLIGTSSVVDGNCKIGNGVSVQTGAYITRYTVIEDDVFLGPFCVTTNDKYMSYGGKSNGPIIRRGAKIGANATLLAGVVVGENAVVGAGAVVTKNVKPGDTVVGNPAKSMKNKHDEST